MRQWFTGLIRFDLQFAVWDLSPVQLLEEPDWDFAEFH